MMSPHEASTSTIAAATITHASAATIMPAPSLDDAVEQLGALQSSVDAE